MGFLCFVIDCCLCQRERNERVRRLKGLSRYKQVGDPLGEKRFSRSPLVGSLKRNVKNLAFVTPLKL